MRLLGHSTVRLRMGGQVVLTDPVLTPRTPAVAGPPRMPGPVGARMRRLLVAPPHEFAAAVAAAGHPTDVLVVPPGETVEPGRAR